MQYRIDLKYLGSPFEGWQSQRAGTGVQDYLERALGTMLRHPTRIVGAGRTDSGVHAQHQVAAFRTDVPFDELKWMKSLHGLLPDGIGITSLQPVEDDFHPIGASTGKAYAYRIWRGASRDPHLAPYCWRVYGALDVPAMREEAGSYIGLHDYTSFCATDSGAKTRERRVCEVSLHEQGPVLEVWVIGEGFLKQMVRTMVGTLVDIGAARIPRGGVSRALAARDRKAAGMTAPAQGLTLERVFFDPSPLPRVIAVR